MRNLEIGDLTKAVGKSDMDADVIEAVNAILHAVEGLYEKIEKIRDLH